MAMLFIARHGETEWNLADRIQGKGDSPLTARGVAQACGLAAFLVEVGIDRLYASPQGRARRTAEIVAEATGCTPQFDDRLVEASYGVADGLTIAEAKARYPGWWERREADRWRVALPGAESIADVWRRAESFAGDCLSGVVDDEAVQVAVVAHQGVNRNLLAIVMGWSPEAVLRMTQPNFAVFRCDGEAAACFRTREP
ncbi:MAG: histidine phosphatase family protein [Alphaproteobacteria bacterium]